jgi:hypothetical protein
VGSHTGTRYRIRRGKTMNVPPELSAKVGDGMRD